MADTKEDMIQMRCTYCLQELSYMTDPRQLSCGHIFCMKCLESDYASEEKQCRVCRKTFTIEELKLVPKVTLVTLETGTQALQTDHKCDICRTNPAPAVIYCFDCKQKICHHHQKHHAGFFEERHQTTSIATFDKKSKMCKDHPSEALCLGCTKCKVMICRDCDHPTNETCDQDDYNYGSGHNFVTAKKLKDTLHAVLNEKLSKLSTAISRLCKLEKNAWQTFDGYIENLSESIQRVKQRTEEQIESIRSSSKMLINQLTDHIKSTTHAMEIYSHGIDNRIGTLDDTIFDLKSFLKNSNTAEVAFHTKKKVELMDVAVASAEKVMEFKFMPSYLCEQGAARSVEYDMQQNTYCDYNYNLSWEEYLSTEKYGLY